MARHIPKPKPHQAMTIVTTKATVKPEKIAENRAAIAEVEAAVREGRVTPLYLSPSVRQVPPEARRKRKKRKNERSKSNGRRRR